MTDKKDWDNHLDSIMMVAQELREHEPEDEELNRIRQFDEDLWWMLDFIKEGRPDTV